MNWINQNRDWFLSGAGIFIISSLVSFASVVATLIIKSRTEGKRQKKLCIATNVTKFAIPSPQDNSAIKSDKFTVSYQGAQYKNLCLFKTQVTNIGNPAISTQSLHLIFPIDANIVEIIEQKSLPSLTFEKSEIVDAETREIVFKIGRLEPNDVFTISSLVETDKPDAITCKPRGVDEIEYTQRGDVDQSDVNILIYYAAAFVMANIIPVFGALIQALIVLAAAPILVELARHIISRKKTSNNYIQVSGDLLVRDEARLVINQQTET